MVFRDVEAYLEGTISADLLAEGSTPDDYMADYASSNPNTDDEPIERRHQSQALLALTFPDDVGWLAFDVRGVYASVLSAIEHHEGSKGVERSHRQHNALLRCVVGSPFHGVSSVDRSCLTTTVKELAHAIYADRAFDRLPILADALEEAGRTDEAILAHCRGPGPHVRGCWVVDLLLGKA